MYIRTVCKNAATYLFNIIYYIYLCWHIDMFYLLHGILLHCSWIMLYLFPVGRHLSYFQYCATQNSTAENIGVFVVVVVVVVCLFCTRVKVAPGCVPQSEILRSEVRSIFSFKNVFPMTNILLSNYQAR